MIDLMEEAASNTTTTTTTKTVTPETHSTTTTSSTTTVITMSGNNHNHQQQQQPQQEQQRFRTGHHHGGSTNTIAKLARHHPHCIFHRQERHGSLGLQVRYQTSRLGPLQGNHGQRPARIIPRHVSKGWCRHAHFQPDAVGKERRGTIPTRYCSPIGILSRPRQGHGPALGSLARPIVSTHAGFGSQSPTILVGIDLFGRRTHGLLLRRISIRRSLVGIVHGRSRLSNHLQRMGCPPRRVWTGVGHG
mmetsp:Transcript_19478/g.53594  ORF Transcript_19478/g.53594 Transcript_19478/m.53594 type:complete len:247 (-) Transcript_19478:632-1372(-)